MDSPRSRRSQFFSRRRQRRTCCPGPDQHGKGRREITSNTRSARSSPTCASRACSKLLKGRSPGEGRQQGRGGREGPVRRARAPRRGQDLHDRRPSSARRSIRPTAAPPGRCATRFRSPTARVDNSTIWAPDFSKAYYENLLFSAAPGAVSMRNFYIEQSSNRYTVNGDVTDWVQVPFNEANYGSNYCGGIVCARTWLFVRDAANAWYDAQIAAGKTKARDQRLPVAVRHLGSLRFQRRRQLQRAATTTSTTSRSSMPARARKPAAVRRAPNAIWSHRWYAFYNNIGSTDRPAPSSAASASARATTGSATTRSSPRTAASACSRTSSATTSACPTCTTPAATPAAPRTRPASGRCTRAARTAAPACPADGIGTKPISMSAYEKIYLGWSNYQVVGYQAAGIGQARPGDGEHQAGAAAGRAAAGQDGRDVDRRPVRRRRTCTTRARATISTTR